MILEEVDGLHALFLEGVPGDVDNRRTAGTVVQPARS